jgi:hypothetical protein
MRFFGDQLSVAVDDSDVVMRFGPVDAAEQFHVRFPSNLVAVMCVGHNPRRIRSALLTRLDGLPSDELFAIPATRTASVDVESSTARETKTLPPCGRAATTTSIPPPPATLAQHDTHEPVTAQQVFAIERLLGQGHNWRTTISPQNRAGL